MTDYYVFKPPENIARRDFSKKSVFLGGSIEMGKAVDWQKDLSEFFHKLNWNVFNPRRDDWDPSWTQDSTDPRFSQQVRWELNAMKHADLIIMNFIPDTLSPISLFETGRFAESGKLRVVCPKGFWRKGNIDICCEIDNIPLYENLEMLKLDLAMQL
jgi:hypothetical protein